MNTFCKEPKLNQRIPYLCQHLLILDNVFIRGEQHVELATAQDGNECTTSSWGSLKMNRIAFRLCSNSRIAEISQITGCIIGFLNSFCLDRKKVPLTL